MKKPDLSALTETQKLNLIRDYEKNPLKTCEPLIKQDLHYLYIVLNKSIQVIGNCFGKSHHCIKKYLKLYNIKKSKEQIQECRKNTCLEKYGCTNSLGNKEIREKAKKTILEKYGVENVFQSDQIKEKIKNVMLNKYGSEHFCTSEFYNKDEILLKRDKTNLEKYGIEHPIRLQSFKEKQKQTCLERYGVNNVISSDAVQQKRQEHIEQIIDKIYITKKENNSFGKSNAEDYIHRLLCDKFNEDNVERQYKSDKYPFACDFYVKLLDLYIEYQGFWTHGKCVFNPQNDKHKEILLLWEKRSKDIHLTRKRRLLYAAAINTWTKKDPLKRKAAKENNLNWLEFFSMKEFESWYNNLER